MTGFILLDKPQSMTSFAAVKQVSRLFGEKRAGHTGTLDPMATGVLPILLGRSTRLCGMLLEADKRYEADILLGTVTDTGDITGKVITTSDKEVSDSDIEAVLPQFRGSIMQTPPIYSAIKQNGVRLYELARRGDEAEIPSREIEIKLLEVLSREGNIVKVDVICSKGTYIRSLAEDIGKALGCGATLSALRRTATGGFDISQCVTIEELKANPQAFLADAGRCVEHLLSVVVTDNQRKRFLHGGDLFIDRINGGEKISEGDACRVYDHAGQLLGIADAKGDSLMVRCLIFEGDVSEG